MSTIHAIATPPNPNPEIVTLQVSLTRGEAEALIVFLGGITLASYDLSYANTPLADKTAPWVPEMRNGKDLRDVIGDTVWRLFDALDNHLHSPKRTRATW